MAWKQQAVREVLLKEHAALVMGRSTHLMLRSAFCQWRATAAAREARNRKLQQQLSAVQKRHGASVLQAWREVAARCDKMFPLLAAFGACASP